MSDFIHKLNGIVLGIGNAEKTGSSVEVMNRTGAYTNTDIQTYNMNTNTNTSKEEKLEEAKIESSVEVISRASSDDGGHEISVLTFHTLICYIYIYIWMSVLTFHNIHYTPPPK